MLLSSVMSAQGGREHGKASSPSVPNPSTQHQYPQAHTGRDSTAARLNPNKLKCEGSEVQTRGSTAQHGTGTLVKNTNLHIPDPKTYNNSFLNSHFCLKT